MEYQYKNEQTGETFFPVYIHNFQRNKPDEVRIIGSRELNPENLSYPDKKWVSVKELYLDGEPVNFTPEFVNKHTF